MNKNDLMQLGYLEKEIEAWNRFLKSGKGDENEKKCVSELLIKISEKRSEAVRFIAGIEDSQTRMIFKLRCVDNLSWNKVADCIGGMNSEYTVKKRFYRYLKKEGRAV